MLPASFLETCPLSPHFFDTTLAGKMGFSPPARGDSIDFQDSHQPPPELLGRASLSELGSNQPDSGKRPMASSNVSHYEIIEKIAEGGMGIV